ncbi:uncharacterized protein LOC142605875 [Castanea sativa]|uniref:uncharacterized protein LOC142605875 n=1 Tax=Castanea sativa TaxID=21020 RepID=UPI003F65101A
MRLSMRFVDMDEYGSENGRKSIGGNRKWILVGTDYFTKWVKAKPLTNIRDLDAKKYSTPAYPQGNEYVEAVNKVIVNELKRRLDDAKGKCVEELPYVLWTYRTTLHRSIGETPFSMTYGADVVIPLETGFPMLKTNLFTPNNNDNLLEKSLDLIEERRKCHGSVSILLTEVQTRI